jgi:hypothetical protein
LPKIFGSQQSGWHSLDFGNPEIIQFNPGLDGVGIATQNIMSIRPVTRELAEHEPNDDAMGNAFKGRLSLHEQKMC